MVKRIYIVHRWSGKPESDWYPWIKSELEKKGFEVIVPTMKNTDEPNINEWVNQLKEIVKIDGGTYFIAHSIGCQTVLRFLESLDNDVKIGGCVFVAGWFNLENLEGADVENIARPWLKKKINFAKVRKIANKIDVFLSSNEPYGYVKENAKIFQEELGAQVTILKNKGHFTSEDGVLDIPEVLELF